MRIRAISMAVVTAMLFTAACERESRRMDDDAAMSAPAAGAAQNPYVTPGTLAPPPQPLEFRGPIGPYERNAFMVAEGQRLYQWMNCVGCHAMGGGGMGPPLMDAEWLYGSAPKDVYISIVEGRVNGMPSYRGKLTEQQVWQLVSYVRSMSGQLDKYVSPTRSDHMGVKTPEAQREREHPRAPQTPPEKKAGPK
jgi:cytochrome c oxidase cbb3-type subunit III